MCIIVHSWNVLLGYPDFDVASGKQCHDLSTFVADSFGEGCNFKP